MTYNNTSNICFPQKQHISIILSILTPINRRKKPQTLLNRRKTLSYTPKGSFISKKHLFDQLHLILKKLRDALRKISQTRPLQLLANILPTTSLNSGKKQYPSDVEFMKILIFKTNWFSKLSNFNCISISVMKGLNYRYYNMPKLRNYFRGFFKIFFGWVRCVRSTALFIHGMGVPSLNLNILPSTLFLLIRSECFSLHNVLILNKLFIVFTSGEAVDTSFMIEIQHRKSKILKIKILERKNYIILKHSTTFMRGVLMMFDF